MHSVNFENIDYLQFGNQKQRLAFSALKNHLVMEKLAVFEPLLTGTIPIAIDIDESDLDIICFWSDKKSFVDSITQRFSEYNGFTLTEKIINHHVTILADFHIDSFQIEIFGQNRRTKDQDAYRHLIIESLILEERGDGFRQDVIKQKKQGLKTEPAFAKLLGIPGDPYEELLHYRPH